MRAARLGFVIATIENMELQYFHLLFLRSVVSRGATKSFQGKQAAKSRAVPNIPAYPETHDRNLFIRSLSKRVSKAVSMEKRISHGA
jgi:hypothetical protein